MQKKEFIYRSRPFILVWMLIFAGPYILFVPDFLGKIEGPLYYIVNTLLTIFIVFLLWKVMNNLPGIKRKGYYWKENGTTVIEYKGRMKKLDSVTELYLTEKGTFSRGISLLIRNNEEKIEFLSEKLNKNTIIEDTSYYNMFAQIHAENLHLKQEKDIWGESIDYWYKA